MKTEQELFWEGHFGDEYISRNQSKELLAANLYLFSEIFRRTGKLNSVLELGCNIGMNLTAIGSICPEIKISGIDINKKSLKLLKDKKQDYCLYNQSILDKIEVDSADLTFTKGVLIHINPDKLDNVYENLYEKSNKYILINEYYNPEPVMVSYRGHEDRLFKRDFCSELMSKYNNLTLIDYGFGYRNDPVFKQDDLTWFLLKKT